MIETAQLKASEALEAWPATMHASETRGGGQHNVQANSASERGDIEAFTCSALNATRGRLSYTRTAAACRSQWCRDKGLAPGGGLP